MVALFIYCYFDMELGIGFLRWNWYVIGTLIDLMSLTPKSSDQQCFPCCFIFSRRLFAAYSAQYVCEASVVTVLKLHPQLELIMNLVH